MSTVGLYIHIPFCVRKCNYCDFYSIAANESSMDEYVSILIKSLHKWSDKLSGRTVDTIYFGGGTPSVLGTERINRLLFALAELFYLSQDAEITIEVNPNTSTSLDFSSVKSSGINRVSMGLQSSDNEELRLLGRLHNLSDAEKTVERIIRGGISNFSLDVMLGIPKQTTESLSKTLDFCIDSGATHISTYMLKIEENTPFYRNADNLVFSDDDTQADMYEFTSKRLTGIGFRHYEISNFCRDDLVSRHNMKYWMLDDYVGIGPSAHSLLDSKRFYYPRSFNAFSEDKVIFESEGNTPEEYLMLSLRTDLGFNRKKYKELFNLSLPTEFMTEAIKLEKLGLVHLDDDTITLTEKGFLVSNTIITRLISTGIV